MKIFSAFLSRSLVLIGFVVLAGQAVAQVGNDNPTGVAGIFNGDITTGGSYDPYTGNVRRTVTDIAVAGAVGEYPLTFSRSYNSRLGYGAGFGTAGCWQHNYEWRVADSPSSTTPNVPPTSYIVNFPDGRAIGFTDSASDIYFRGPPGVRERFIPLNQTTMLAYLILPDGGKVEFKATQETFRDNNCPDGCPLITYYYFSYAPQAIIDPYGLRTTLTYDTAGRLSKITEPAGRYIQLFYTTTTGPVIDHVTAVTGTGSRSVQYYYGQSAFSPGTSVYTYLDHVVYYGNTAWTARYKYQAPNTGLANANPLLSTCDDPMYPGPMHMIAYTYRTTTNPDGSAPVYGQISSEKYYDGVAAGVAVSTLTVTGTNTRTETRGDGKTRTFTYLAGGYLSSCTDFKGDSASQTYDANKYVNGTTDRNGNTTNFTSTALTGMVTQVKYPLTTADTPGQTVRPTVNYTYGSASCADANNRDANNPYYVCTATDEGGNVTSFTRNANKRVTRIDYPDGGYETFTYNSFGEVLTHRMTTAGTESFTYDADGLKLTYRNPSNASGNPTARYQYDTLDRVSGVTDALGTSSGDVNHTTSFTYNARGQVTVTTHPKDPTDNVRHTVTNVYNSDGTLASKTDELAHATSYTYDDYRRVSTIVTPQRSTGDTTPRTTRLYYDASGTGDDYRYTDASVTYLVLPSVKKSKTVYDENRRKISVTVAVGTTDAATTSYGYDDVGNLTSVVAPNQQTGQQYAGKSTVTIYDQRNRPSSVKDALLNQTTFTYDLGGRKRSVTRPNGQVITYDSYDEMNRLLQQTVKQTPNPDAVTKYTYTTAGLLDTMQDPRLVALNSAYKYDYTYDTTGRKTKLTYPPDSTNVQRTEIWTYDTAGRLATFTNRAGKVQTFTFDALNRMTGFSWNDGVTPSVTFDYDAASRLIEADNANASIPIAYFNDNLLKSETEHITGSPYWGTPVSNTYDADGNRASNVRPDGGGTDTYTYTGRNQLKTISEEGFLLATYTYDVNGNLSSRAPFNSTSSTYTYDALDRVTHISHNLVGTTRTFDYGYDNVGNRNWTQRDGGNGDVFDYDLSDQATVAKLNIANPSGTAPGAQAIFYDANGNRTSFGAYGTTDTYTINNLNQYTRRNTTSATYDLNGNLTTGVDGSTYTYDAQNRLISATKNGGTETYKYDAFNRQVSASGLGYVSYSIWDGWNLIINHDSANNWTNAYWHGPGGMLAEWESGTRLCYSDASGSTTHLADKITGALLESYRYDLHGTPIFYNASNTQISASAYGIRHLFTGQFWKPELGLYDLRNRFYSPDIGRFLQADPISFWGDRTNLYRYCRNNPVTRRDPFGLQGEDFATAKRIEQQNNTTTELTYERVVVPGTAPEPAEHTGPNVLDFSGGGGGNGGGAADGGGGGGGGGGGDRDDETNSPDKTPSSTPSSTPPPSPSIMNPQPSPSTTYPTTTPTPTPNQNQVVQANASYAMAVGAAITAFGMAIKNPYVQGLGIVIFGVGFNSYMGTLHQAPSPTPTATYPPGGA